MLPTLPLSPTSLVSSDYADKEVEHGRFGTFQVKFKPKFWSRVKFTPKVFNEIGSSLNKLIAKKNIKLTCNDRPGGRWWVRNGM